MTDNLSDRGFSPERRAGALVEALPYIQRFRDAVVVVKFGGNAMVDPALSQTFAEDIVLLRSVGLKPVVVHGGGPQIGELLTRLGKETAFVDGLRVTDAETLDVARMVLVGKVGRDIVGSINVHGAYAVGLSGEDGGLITAAPRDAALGFVGDVVSVQPNIVERLLSENMIPVVSTIGADANGQAYNINADTVAGALAGALGAEKAIYLTDVPGLLTDVDDASSIVARASLSTVREYIVDGTISGGMIPKVEACMHAVESGATSAHMLDGRIPHVLLLELFTDAGIGTMITGDLPAGRTHDRRPGRSVGRHRRPQPVDGQLRLAASTFREGSGAELYDANGTRHLDFLCGLAVTGLGHAHPAITEAVAAQAGTLTHTSNLFANEHQAPVAETLNRLIDAGSGQVLFQNSGAEANEAALKLVRKYQGRGRHGVVSALRSFHGRTLMSLAATGQPEKHEPFQPLPEGFRHVVWNDLAEFERSLTPEVGGVILESVQGEGGVNPADDDYLRGVRQICDERGLLLIFDEVQAGMGRTGAWFGFQHASVRPDVVTMAKGIANGMPVGAMWARDDVAAAFVPGDHGSTYAGQPLALSAARATLAELERIDAPAVARARSNVPVAA